MAAQEAAALTLHAALVPSEPEKAAQQQQKQQQQQQQQQPQNQSILSNNADAGAFTPTLSAFSTPYQLSGVTPQPFFAKFVFFLLLLFFSKNFF